MHFPPAVQGVLAFIQAYSTLKGFSPSKLSQTRTDLEAMLPP